MNIECKCAFVLIARGAARATPSARAGRLHGVDVGVAAEPVAWCAPWRWHVAGRAMGLLLVLLGAAVATALPPVVKIGERSHRRPFPFTQFLLSSNKIRQTITNKKRQNMKHYPYFEIF